MTGKESVRRVLLIFLFLSVPPLYLFPDDQGTAIIAPPVNGNLYPLYIAGPQIVPANAVLLSPGTILLSSSFSYGNSFIVEELRSDLTTLNLELDSEAWLFRFKAAISVAEKVELGVELQSSGQYGGFLDPIISGFHHIFGFPDGGREIRDYNQSSFIIYQGDTLMISKEGPVDPALFVNLEAKWALFRGDRITLSLDLWTGLPVVPVMQELREIAKTEGPAIAPRLLAAAGWKSFSFQVGTGILCQDGEISLLEEISAAWSTDSPFTPVMSISGRSSPYTYGYERSDNFSATANIGTFIDFPGLGRFQATFTQEFFTFAAADIGFHIGWSRLLSTQ